MTPQITKLFRAPYGVPNGLQVRDEGLWIVDQITDRVALIEISPPSDYGVTKFIRDIPSQSSNTSGLAYGEEALWLAANGAATIWRPARPHDAPPGTGEILKANPQTGETLARYPVPDGGGTHGVEYDNFDPGHLWVTTLKSQTLSKVRLSDWTAVQTLALPYKRAHGVVRVADGVWVAHTADRIIIKLDVETGAVLTQIEVPPEYPEPHGLSIYGENFLYCDATSGWVVEIKL